MLFLFADIANHLQKPNIDINGFRLEMTGSEDIMSFWFLDFLAKKENKGLYEKALEGLLVKRVCLFNIALCSLHKQGIFHALFFSCHPKYCSKLTIFNHTASV